MSEVVVEFPRSSEFYKFLEGLRVAYDEGRLLNFLCIYDYDYREGEELEGFACGIDSYWYGRSSTMCLGLSEVIKARVLDYIREKNTE